MRKKYFITHLLILVFICAYSQDNQRFKHSYWEWFSASEMTDARLDEVAPHFPLPKDYDYNIDKYDQAIFRWQKIFCFEYERFINAPELTALNPYYEGYIDAIQLPYFLGPLESDKKPDSQNFSDDFEGKVDYELALQNWYFVFHPDEYAEKYEDIEDELPFWFDTNTYRQAILKKIEDNKKSSK